MQCFIVLVIEYFGFAILCTDLKVLMEFLKIDVTFDWLDDLGVIFYPLKFIITWIDDLQNSYQTSEELHFLPVILFAFTLVN